MNSSIAASHPSAQRLWYNLPQEADEDDDSWLLRTACLYDVTPQQMVAHLRQFDLGTAIADAKAAESGHVLPIELGLSANAAHSDLGSYCPICFARDWKAGRMPYFRRAWTEVWITHCAVDNTPLFLWPYRESIGQVVLPHWMSEMHFARRRGVRITEENREFVIQLRHARMVRKWMVTDAAEVLGWLQQMELERLMSSRVRPPTYALMGISPTAIRRVVADTATLLYETFNGGTKSLANYLASFLGPPWLFSRSFAESRRLPGHELRSLRSFRDPAQRRSLVALAIRVHSSSVSDPEFQEDGRLTGTGQTSLSRALRDCSANAKRWARRRATFWPQSASLSICNSLDCEPSVWARPEAAGGSTAAEVEQRPSSRRRRQLSHP